MSLEKDALERREVKTAPSRNNWQAAIANYFQFDYYQTNFRTEILAGITTFMTMAYILVINPLILSDAVFLSEPKDLFTELVVATAVSAGIFIFYLSNIYSYF